MVLITQSYKEVGQLMSAYVGIVRSDLRLQRAMDRLNILFGRPKISSTGPWYPAISVNCETSSREGYMVISRQWPAKKAGDCTTRWIIR